MYKLTMHSSMKISSRAPIQPHPPRITRMPPAMIRITPGLDRTLCTESAVNVFSTSTKAPNATRSRPMI